MIRVSVMSGAKPNATLSELRTRIDQLDEQLISMLAERFRVTEQVGQLKAHLAAEPEDKAREEQQRTRYHALAVQYHAPADAITDVMTRIWEHVKNRHERLRKSDRC